ncbi:hypothetical protein BBP40_010067, partial [Aspergillus hancockii]
QKGTGTRRSTGKRNKNRRTFEITITPHGGNQGLHLSVQAALDDPCCTAHQPLFIFETRYGNVAAHLFTESAVVAYDAAGPLSIYFSTVKEPDQEWRVGRATSGDVILQFTALPREIDITTPVGPRVDMRCDQGGLIAAGRWFLPRPAADSIYRNVVKWDLSQTPEGTRAVWSYGEGPEPVIKEGNPMVVADRAFMVGLINSYPDSAIGGNNSPGAKIKIDMIDSQGEFYDNWYAEMIPYMRGCIYLLQIDSRLRHVTGRFGIDHNSPLDDIVIAMAKRWQCGERLYARDWLDYLQPYLGEEVCKDFHNMLKGHVLDLHDVSFIYKEWPLSLSMHEILEFDLNKSSTNTRLVSGLVPGSRAAIAGLRDGDRILSMSRASLCTLSLYANFELFIERVGKQVHIAYWPRSFKKAEVWHLMQ